MVQSPWPDRRQIWGANEWFSRGSKVGSGNQLILFRYEISLVAKAAPANFFAFNSAAHRRI